ncbi:MAG: PKD domain-containing protein, partial [Nitrospira sp.]
MSANSTFRTAIGPDTVAPTVTVNQAAGQGDPTGTSPITFAVVFSEPVTNFTTGDVTLSGTAGATTATVAGSGTTYTVAVSGMSATGTVIATIGAGVASDAAGNLNQAGTSTDNTVNVLSASSFQNEVLATGFNFPTAIKFLPDGRLLVVEFAGTIKVLQAPYTQPDPTPFLQLTNVVSSGFTQGVYDIALDPNFSTNHYYYLFYTADTPNRDRLSRFTANASLTGTIAGSEVVLYEDPQNASNDHHGGAINFDNDGKIYFTVGDHFISGNAQLLTNPRGKLHRINADGTVPTDNPFYDGAGPNWDSIWAIGLRNPFRAYYDSPTDRLLIGDVGSTEHEEVNVGVRGANYGWPNTEGVSSNPAYTNPIYSYPLNGRDASITGGFVYHGTQFPSSYQGSYFFADYAQNWIRRLTFDANGNVTGVFNFEPANGSPDGPVGDIVYLTEGPDGALYYLDLGFSNANGFGVSQLHRIRYTQANLPPVVAASATPIEGANPLTVNFTSAGSSDPEGLLLSYLWAFGDGQTSTAPDPQHTYANAGLYQARLTVSDGVNSTISTPIAINVGSKPVVTILTTPSSGALFRAGDVIFYSGQATDVEDGPLSASAFTWTIDFLHEGHVHPGTPITGVTSGSFTIPTSGHDFSGFTRYRITLTVTDSDGLQTAQSAIVSPDKVNLAFETAPGGLTLYVDGIAHQGPFVYDTLVGFTHTIEARDQTVSTSTHTFASWSDGGAQQHTITVPAAAQSYVANYTAVTNPLPSGLVAGWSFNEVSGTSATDSSGNNNTATLANGVARTTGNYGGGLTFDGVNDYLTVPNSAS